MIFSGPMVRALLDGRKTQERRIVKPQPVDPCDDPGFSPVELVWRWDHDNVRRCPWQPGDLIWVRETWASPRNHVVAYRAGAECGAWIDTEDGRRWMRHGFILESPDYRESFRAPGNTYGLGKYGGIPRGMYPYRYTWSSSTSMPKWAARIWLRVTGVRAERLQDISEQDAVAEGVAPLFTQDEIARHVARAADPAKIKAGYDAMQPMPWRNYLWHGLPGLKQRQIDAWPHQYSSYAKASESYSSLWESLHGPGAWAANPWVWVIEFERDKR